MIKQYTTLVIDMYGVILKERKTAFLEFISAKTGKDFEEIQKLHLKAESGEISAEELAGCLDITDLEKFASEYVSTLSMDEDFMDFCEKVKDKYDIVLLSNDIPFFSRKITKHFGIEKFFKYTFTSGDLKSRKPEFKAFDLALEKMGKAPSECIFVDNAPKNLLAAEEVGLAPILFTRENDHYYGASVVDFKELSGFIG